MKRKENKNQNFKSVEIKNEFSQSGKNTLKSRIHAMDKGWIKKKKEIKSMNRTTGNLKENFVAFGGTLKF